MAPWASRRYTLVPLECRRARLLAATDPAQAVPTTYVEQFVSPRLQIVLHLWFQA